MEEKTIFNDLGTLNNFLASEASKRVRETNVPYDEAWRQIVRENPALIHLRHEFSTAGVRSMDGLRSVRDGRDRLRRAERQISVVVDSLQAEHPELDRGQAYRLAASEYRGVFERARDIRREIERLR